MEQSRSSNEFPVLDKWFASNKTRHPMKQCHFANITVSRARSGTRFVTRSSCNGNTSWRQRVSQRRTSIHVYTLLRESASISGIRRGENPLGGASRLRRGRNVSAECPRRTRSRSINFNYVNLSLSLVQGINESTEGTDFHLSSAAEM